MCCFNSRCAFLGVIWRTALSRYHVELAKSSVHGMWTVFETGGVVCVATLECLYAALRMGRIGVVSCTMIRSSHCQTYMQPDIPYSAT
jgi:hypothetical protein